MLQLAAHVRLRDDFLPFFDRLKGLHDAVLFQNQRIFSLTLEAFPTLSRR